MTSITTPTARELIYSRFITQWGTTTPLTFDNEAFDPPEGKAWVRLTVRHNDSNFETLGGVGNRRVRREGSIFIQVFTPGDKGTQKSDTLVQTARAVFEGVSFGPGVDCNNAVDREVGPDGAHYMRVVECFFAYEERK